MFIKDIFLEYVFIRFSFVIVVIIHFNSVYVALAGLEVSVLNRMTLSSQRPISSMFECWEERFVALYLDTSYGSRVILAV